MSQPDMAESASNPHRFLCDEMLKGLARWLRAAGYDTLTCDTGYSDRELLNKAISENRLLITRDKKLTEFRLAAGTVIWLKCNELSDCVDELTRQVRVDWLFRPFSRCLLCNTSLQAADHRLYDRIPANSRAHAVDVLYCPACDKLFWEGSHVHRMQKNLSEWKQRQSRIN